MRATLRLLLLLPLLHPCALHGSVFGRLQGVVHDPQHRPVAGAKIIVQAAHSDLQVTSVTDGEGLFTMPSLSLGEYVVTVTQPGFRPLRQQIIVASTASATVHFELTVSAANETVTVMSGAPAVHAESVTPTTLVNREQIARTPGADRTNSLQMITDFVPGASMTHDMLHMRGGHQLSWLIDGVQIPNTNISSNVGAQIDPKDIDYLEVQRGSYAAEVGDRTYGVFNVVPRTGFERSREGELVLSLGNFFQTNDQLNIGSHTDRFAYYASLNGNRSNYGLAPPTSLVRHDAVNGFGGFGSLIYNRTSRDQIRAVAQLRRDFFQIPYDPDPASSGNQQYDSSGLRDAQHESDGLVDMSWLHTWNASTVTELSPFYHYNRADYTPGSTDTPIATTVERGSNYAGVQASITVAATENTLQAGFYGFGQRDAYGLGAAFHDRSRPDFLDRQTAAGGVLEEFVSDTFRPAPWLTLTAGLRSSYFRGDFGESALSPRVGASLDVPRLHWVLRGFYGHFYQPPPLLTASGTVVAYADSQNTSFQPLHGERDEEHQFGVQIPWRGWVLDADTFRTRAKDFLDHANIGASSIYYPVTIDGALIDGWELTVRSPLLLRRANLHLAYSNQTARQRGAITGGLVCAPVASPVCSADFAYTPLDHDQRNTLSAGFTSSLPLRAFASGNVAYGSGFRNGSPDALYPGAYLPQHTSVDLSLGREFGARTTLTVNALNLSNQRVLLDNSLTFGGFHTSDPRQIYGELRLRLHY